MPTDAPTVPIVGSLHYDIMVEAPDRPRKGETLVGEGWRPVMGGKGRNQAVAAARAGAGVAMIGAVGRDGFGFALLASLDEAGVDRRHVVELMQQWTRLKEDEPADVAFLLVVDAELFRLDALVRWLDAVDGRVARLPRAADGGRVAPAPRPRTTPERLRRQIGSRR